MSARKRNVATFEDFAAATFEGDSEPADALPDRLEWLRRAGKQYEILAFAFAAMKQDAAGLQDAVAKVGEEPILELTQCVRGLIEFYEATAGLLKSAEARLLVGMARHEVAKAA